MPRCSQVSKPLESSPSPRSTCAVSDACLSSSSRACSSNSSMVRVPERVISNSSRRCCSVASPTCTTATTWDLVRRKPWMCAAMYSAAPQIPLGLRPVCIQSRFMEATRRSAVLDTACMRFLKSSLSANRWMNKLGSTGFWNMGCCSRRKRWQSCRNTAPSTNTLVCSMSEKSMSMNGLPSCRHTMYRHAPATCWTRRPRVKLRCRARR
mmetsp:Transcript_46876/g.89503  ORF Transcript_46876/g.89503 Transcript_46876/m.89503 type:complete len:209 (-) Transcript_46876:148-774(-)